MTTGSLKRLATIVQSGLCKTNTVPRPQPSLFFFPGATKLFYLIHYDLISLLHLLGSHVCILMLGHILKCRIDIEANF